MSWSLIAKAEDLARQSQMMYKHCCLVVSTQGKILATGINRPVARGGKFSIHAEVDALRRYKGCLQRPPY